MLVSVYLDGLVNNDRTGQEYVGHFVMHAMVLSQQAAQIV